jgi:hypothetical protein
MTEMENGWPAQTYRADSCYYSIEKKKKKPSLFFFFTFLRQGKRRRRYRQMLFVGVQLTPQWSD